ncbi:hypothetical protein [Streptomyces sp. NPDC054838]
MVTMTKRHPSLPTTESAVTAVREIADAYRLTMTVVHDIGADQTSRRSSAELFKATDPDGTLPHEAFIDLAGRPAVSVRLFPEDDALITVDGVEFHDVPRDSVPAFLRSVYGGLAYVKARSFPPGYRLTIPLPADETHHERVSALTLTPWLASILRP